MKEHKIITPEEAAAKVRDIINANQSDCYGPDVESIHTYTDTLMEEILISLGYGDAVDLIRDTERWYS